jgi:hypothetical protein
MISYFDVPKLVATFCYEHPSHATNQQQIGLDGPGDVQGVFLSRAGDSSEAKPGGGHHGSSTWRNCCAFLSRAGDSSKAKPAGGGLSGGTNGSWV